MLTAVPSWFYAFVILILGGFCSVGWWAIRRWVERVDNKLEVIDANFIRLPCVIEANMIKPPGGNSAQGLLICTKPVIKEP